jgi:hypothetical protein
MPIVTSLTSNGVFQTIGGLGSFDEISLDSGSIFFNGTGDYLKSPTSSAFAFGTGDFTMEAWVYPNSVSGVKGVVSTRIDISSKTDQVFFGINDGAVLYFSGFAIQGGTIPVNTWSHIACSRQGTTVRVFLNGVVVTSSTDANSKTTTFGYIGAGAGDNSQLFAGYISNARFIKGTAVYTSAFTPPTAPLTPVANTSLLLTASPQNPYLDSSNNNFTITRNGTPRFNSIGPFYYPGNTSINLANTNNNPVLGSNTNIITSTTSNGVVMVTGEFDEVSMSSGSLRFDGSTGYLSVPYSSNFEFGNENFTIEFWMYSSGISSQGLMSFPHNASNYGQALFFGGGSSSLAFYSSSDGINWDVANASSLGSINLNAWNHIAVSKSGSSIRTFKNGVLQATITFAGTFAGTYDRCWIGDTSQNSHYNGLFSNIRVVKGTALYTANFTPPTSPLTAIGGTQLLLNTTPSQPFVDSSSNNLTITVNGGVTANTFTPFTFSPFANTQRKILNTGTMMVKEYDEVTGSPVVDSSLQLWYDAGQSTSYPGSGSTWTDLSGKNNTGTLVDSPAYSSADGGSIVFNGTSNQVTTTTFFTNPATFSVGVWFKTSVASGKKLIGFQATQTGSSSSYDRMIYMGTDGKLYFGVYDGNTNTAVSPLTYNNNVWHYALATYGGEGSTMRLYVDGQSVATATALNAENYNGYWRIGAFNVTAWPGGASSGYFSGNISIAQVYSRSLNSTEVLQNFNAVRGRYNI